MKFKKYIPPKKGDIRYKTKFAWYPVKINDNLTILFEHYRVTYEWQLHVLIPGKNELLKDSYNDRWVEIKRQLIVYENIIKYIG